MLRTRNGLPVALADVPELAPEAFRAACVEACAGGARVAALCRWGDVVLAVLAEDGDGRLALLATRPPLASLTPALPQAQGFERELLDDGVEVVGHPWPKPLRRHDRPHPFFQVDGPGVHEVAVGPVHAGVIEPGHFRFQCHGETVISLEIQLGWQHRGAEALLRTAPPARRLVVAESIAGDTAVGHAFAHCYALEAGTPIPLAAKAIRGIALELERIANHVGDLGALCGDVGYLPGASVFGRLRGDFLNLLLELSGNRFGRGLVVPGGVRFGLGAAQRGDFQRRLAAAERDLRPAAETTFDSASVLARFEHTGVVSAALVHELGLVGPVARAAGVSRDVRADHPSGIYRFAHIPVGTVESGDVMGRALVRWLEIQRSLTFIKEQLREAPEGPLTAAVPEPRPGTLAVALVEGWRGEIVHIAGAGGYKVVDPSFHNWLGLAIALRGNQISDFPLCNKSFNLSYAGHDL